MSLNDADGFEQTTVLKANQVASYPRVLMYAGLTGDNALASAVKIKMGKWTIATVKAYQANPSLQANELIPVMATIPANQPLDIVCTEAMSTDNNIHLVLVPQSYFRRRLRAPNTYLHEDLGSMTLNAINGMTLTEQQGS